VKQRYINRGASEVDLIRVRDIIEGAGDPHYRLDEAGITPYSLACTLIEYVDLNEDKFRTIQAYCKAASEDKAEIKRLREELDRLNRRVKTMLTKTGRDHEL
jgi:hypothetical protein